MGGVIESSHLSRTSCLVLIISVFLGQDVSPSLEHILATNVEGHSLIKKKYIER